MGLSRLKSDIITYGQFGLQGLDPSASRAGPVVAPLHSAGRLEPFGFQAPLHRRDARDGAHVRCPKAEKSHSLEVTFGVKDAPGALDLALDLRGVWTRAWTCAPF